MNTALDQLLKTQPALWRGKDQYNEYAAIPTGYAQLNAALPSGGWGIGCVTELILEQRGIGEFSLLLPALKQITNHQPGNAKNSSNNHKKSNKNNSDAASDSISEQWAALIHPPYLPYAPAMINAGINLERLLIINTDNDNDTLWATEQLLRAGIFTAVVSWVNRTTLQKQRRLQLAAEAGKTWAAIYRPASAQKEHSPVAVRMVLSHTSSNALGLNIIKSRGGQQRNITIIPAEFDTTQGVEWPGIHHATSCSGLASISPACQ